MRVINADGLILGRMATKVAKLALLGEEIAIVNCEKAIISGRPEKIIERYLHKERIRSATRKGPFIPKMADRFVRRVIRGMLPKKHWSEGSRGRQAFSRVKCYIGVPEEFKNAKLGTISEASADKLKTPYYLTVGRLLELAKGRKYG